MNTVSLLAKPIAGVTAVAVVLASLLAFFAFGAKPVKAQDPDIVVNPVNVELGDLAEGEVKTTTITITNPSDSGGVLELGEIDLNLLGGDLDGILEDINILQILGADGLELLDPADLTLLNLLGLDDLLGNGVFDLDLLGIDPISLNPGESVDLVLELVTLDDLDLLPNQTGDINLDLQVGGVLNDTDILSPTVPVTGTAQQCTINGTDNAETIPGTQGSDVICARGGNDRVTDIGGNDIIFAGEGSDQVDAGPGKDKVYAGSGNNGAAAAERDDVDKLNGEGGRDRLDAKDGEGNDILKGGPGKDKLVKDKKDRARR